MTPATADNRWWFQALVWVFLIVTSPIWIGHMFLYEWRRR